VNTSKLDLTRAMFGDSFYTPILIGPVAELKRYHPDGELAMAKGAVASKSGMVVSSRSSFPIEQIAGQAKGTTLWYQVFPEAGMGAVRAKALEAVKAGCKAVCLTVGPMESGGRTRFGIDWSAIEGLRRGLSVPFLIKGIMTPEEARTAVEKGAQGIIVSGWTPVALTGMAQPIEVLPAVADAVGGEVPILIDGGFPRPSDVRKAL